MQQWRSPSFDLISQLGQSSLLGVIFGVWGRLNEALHVVCSAQGLRHLPWWDVWAAAVVPSKTSPVYTNSSTPFVSVHDAMGSAGWLVAHSSVFGLSGGLAERAARAKGQNFLLSFLKILRLTISRQISGRGGVGCHCFSLWSGWQRILHSCSFLFHLPFFFLSLFLGLPSKCTTRSTTSDLTGTMAETRPQRTQNSERKSQVP